MLSQGTQGQRDRVAIPRLPDRYTSKPGRVSRACDECRSRKAKCDARRPVCGNCARVKLACVYSEPKRDRDKTELEATRAKIDYYERVLRDISEEVDQDVAQKIKRALVCSMPQIRCAYADSSCSYLHREARILGRAGIPPMYLYHPLVALRVESTSWTKTSMRARTAEQLVTTVRRPRSLGSEAWRCKVEAHLMVRWTSTMPGFLHHRGLPLRLQ